MNENIDLTKILEGCPEGTKFYSSNYGNVQFIDINLASQYPIRLMATDIDNGISEVSFTKRGTYLRYFDGECTLFPSKDQRDWSKFVRFWDKPKKEKFDVNTLQPFDKVLVRDYLNECWNVDIFGFTLNNYIRCTTTWRYCIPYNEETKHLVGTKEDCPEFYKWWKE